jgi:hypothetical protein
MANILAPAPAPVAPVRKTGLFLVTDRASLSAALEQGITFTTLVQHAATGATRGAQSWAEVCRYGSEDMERLESVAAIIAATESENARASLYAGARRAIKAHPDAVAIIAKRKTETGADGYTVRTFDAAAAAAAANAAADKREEAKAASEAAAAAAAAKAADDAAFITAILDVLGTTDRDAALSMLRELAAPVAATEASTAAAA